MGYIATKNRTFRIFNNSKGEWYCYDHLNRKSETFETREGLEKSIDHNDIVFSNPLSEYSIIKTN